MLKSNYSYGKIDYTDIRKNSYYVENEENDNKGVYNGEKIL